MTATYDLEGSGTPSARQAAFASLSTAALLGRCLLVINSFTFLAFIMVVSISLLSGNLYGIAGLVTELSFFYFTLIGFPVSVLCLWREPKPLWTRIALFLNAPFFLLQSLILALVFLMVLVNEWT